MTETANVNTATADAGSTRGKLRDTDRGRTLPSVLAAGVGAAVAGVAMIPNTGSAPRTLALFVGICAGALLSAALFLALSSRRRNRWLVSSAASEEALNQSDARARAVIDNAVDAIAIIDANGIIMSFNRAAYRMFGYEPHEVIGRNVSMLMPEPHRTRHDAYICIATSPPPSRASSGSAANWTRDAKTVRRCRSISR